MNQVEFREALETARLKHQIPGISGAAYIDGEAFACAAGVANVVTGVEMTTETVAHIGSITKLLNATLLMQLVDAKLVSLEAPVAKYLPLLRIRDERALRTITVEQLVNHTSGIDANLLPDAGHDEETIERTVERFAGAEQMHDPGAARSYCNAGTVIAGYLCQKLTGTSWYDLLKVRIFAPLEMEHAAVLPEDALLHRYSVGHVVDTQSGLTKRTGRAFLPLGYAPAGSTAMMSASSLLSFVRAHIAGGRAANERRILSSESADKMRVLSGNVSGYSCFDGGIGWLLLPGGLVHHGGGGPGILSWLVAYPPSQTIVVVLTNAENGFKAVNDVIGPIFASRFGVVPFPAPRAIALGPEFEFSEYTGVYENNTTSHHVRAQEGRLFWSARAKADYADASSLEERAPIPLEVGENGMFFSDGLTIRFTPPKDGRAEYLIHSYRMHRRSGEEILRSQP